MIWNLGWTGSKQGLYKIWTSSIWGLTGSEHSLYRALKRVLWLAEWINKRTKKDGLLSLLLLPGYCSLSLHSLSANQQLLWELEVELLIAPPWKESISDFDWYFCLLSYTYYLLLIKLTTHTNTHIAASTYTCWDIPLTYINFYSLTLTLYPKTDLAGTYLTLKLTSTQFIPKPHPNNGF